MAMHDDGEPISRGQVDRRVAEARALRNSLFAAALFGVVFLVNGILVVLLIEFVQAIGWWELPAVRGQDGAVTLSENLGRLDGLRPYQLGNAP